MFGEHRLLFRPRDSFDQTPLSSHLKVEPKPEYIRWIHDVFGNCVAVLGFAQPARELAFETIIRLDHTPHVPINLQIDEQALTYPFRYDPDEALDLERTIQCHYPDEDDQVGKFARQFVRIGKPTKTGRLLMTMCYAIHESFVYARRHEHGTQAPTETLNLRRGTCRDFALLMRLRNSNDIYLSGAGSNAVTEAERSPLRL